LASKKEKKKQRTMPVLDLQNPSVGFQLLTLSSDEDQEMMEGVVSLLGLRHKSPPHYLQPAHCSHVTKALRGGGSGEFENGRPSSSFRSTTPTIDLGVQEYGKKRKRATREEVAVLRRAFAINPLPPLEVRMSIAHQLNWTPRKVKIWFQNERAKVRKRTREGDLLERIKTPDSENDEMKDSTPQRGSSSSRTSGGGCSSSSPSPSPVATISAAEEGFPSSLLINRSITPSGVLQSTPFSSMSHHQNHQLVVGLHSPPRLSSSAPEDCLQGEVSPLSHSQIHCAVASAFSRRTL
jgi:hypothetical protein